MVISTDCRIVPIETSHSFLRFLDLPPLFLGYVLVDGLLPLPFL